MAKISNTAGSSNIWLGSKGNTRQSILYVPAALTANKPGLLFLESINDGAAVSDLGGIYLWADDSDELHVSATYPTNQDDAATIVAAAGGTAALLAAAATDHSVIRGDGGVRGVQKSGIIIDDSDGISAISALALDDDGTIGVASDSDSITINSTGQLTLTQDLTVDEDIIIGDDKYIGSASDPDAMQIDSSGNVILTQNLHLDADDLQLQLGNETTDAYLKFDGTNLLFYDTTYGSTVSLTALMSGTSLNPSVTGDLTIPDGKFNWTDATDETAATWSFANTGGGSDIDMATVMDTGEGIHIIANALTTGKVLKIETDSIGAAGALIHLDITQAAHDNAGFFFEAFDGAGNVFSVGEYGAMIVAGTATGTDILTATAGDITLTDGDCTLTDGDYVVTEGKITVSTVTDETSFIKRNLTGATSAVFELEATHTGDTGVVLLIDQLGTGNQTAIDLNVAGDLPAIDIDASAARSGDVIDIAMANMLDQRALYISGNITSAAGEGVIHIDLGTGVLNATGNALLIEGSGNHAAGSHMVELNFDTGTAAGATDGSILGIYDTSGAAATSYAVEIDSTNNEALHVDAGKVLVDETVTATLGLVTASFDTDVTQPPTDAEIDAVTDAAIEVDGGMVFIDDAGAHTQCYLCIHDGTVWHNVAMTLCV